VKVPPSPRTAKRLQSFAHFFRLLAAACGPNVFNPWTQRDQRNDGALNGPAARRERLRAHLRVQPDHILIGEAAGYQGCHVTGMAFTSERLIMTGVIPRIAAPDERLSTRHIPWSEPSATTVWKTLHALKIEQNTILWNAFPWHPHRPGNLQSNRTPTRLERQLGLVVLDSLLSAVPKATVFAVGRHAESILDEVGRAAIPLRHPSMGGALLFRRGLQRALMAK
jgi:uracil-DNA glycosylase